MPYHLMDLPRTPYVCLCSSSSRKFLIKSQNPISMQSFPEQVSYVSTSPELSTVYVLKSI